MREKTRYRLAMAGMISLNIVIMAPAVHMAAVNAKDTYIKQEYVQYCEEIGAQYSISPELLEALIETESSGNAMETSDHGAVGLTQVIPKYSRYSMYELYQPRTSIKAGAEILVEFCEKYGDAGMALVAYNCGEYSRQFKESLRTGELTGYANKILDRAYELERIHGKHDY